MNYESIEYQQNNFRLAALSLEVDKSTRQEPYLIMLGSPTIAPKISSAFALANSEMSGAVALGTPAVECVSKI